MNVAGEGIPLVQVDAFTSAPFGGNPAAVCLLTGPADEAWMQDVAREMNLSETAFLYPEGSGYRLRWFTPTVEVDLCGHATLASAHVLWETGRVQPATRIDFQTKSGRLSAERHEAWIELDFPAKPVEPVEPPSDLLAALGAPACFVGRNRFDYLVEVEGASTVRALRPDLPRLASLPVRGVMVTSRSDDPRYDFVSRFFAPGSGIAEDPVTGSAHCALGPYWMLRLEKDQLLGYQASARGGTVRVRVERDRVRLGGQAVTILRGELV
ncbi:MAG: PhzF family phenazine biosynthesis protein [Candidatus Rokuibacteriota bacterium]